MTSIRSVLAAFLLVSGATVARAEEAPAAAAPKIVCDNPMYNFGAAPSSQVISHEYIIKNTGTADLAINGVRPSCGCTVVSITSKVVPPGGETRVSAQLNLAGRQGMQHKAITVDSNDPQQPQLTLLLSGTVAESVQVNRPNVVFGQVNADTVATQEVIVTSGTTNAFKVVGIEVNPPIFDASVDTRAEGKEYAVIVRTKPPINLGNHQAVLRINTDSPARPAIDMMLLATVNGELSFVPTEISLAEQPGEKVVRYIVLRSTAGTPFPVPEVIVPDPSIQAVVKGFGDSGYRIQLNNVPAERSLDGKNLIIKTAVETMKEITVPIHVVGGAPK